MKYVYPGHPITLAVSIIRAFPGDVTEAWKIREGKDFPNALISSEVSGAGGNVYRALDLVRDLHENPENWPVLMHEACHWWYETLDSCYWDRATAGTYEVLALMLELRKFFVKS